MSESRRDRFERFLDSDQKWDNRLPPALRRAAELNFGTWFVAAVILAVKKGIGGAAFFLIAAWLMSEATRTRGAYSQATWWLGVVFGTVFGVFLCVLLLVGV
jgi:hypothetical protein